VKLNLGSGDNKMETDQGWVNVDISPRSDPDVVFDLETFPWPWRDDSCEQVYMMHVLEHLGQDAKVFFGIIKELYRVCAPGARIHIRVPHPRHDHFLCDPTHVRAITPTTMVQFDREKCLEWAKTRNSNSKLALDLGVDFRIVDVQTMLDEPYATQFNEKKLTEEEAEFLCRERNNIATEYQITMEVRKS